MKHYEILLIFKPTLTEEEVKTKFDFIKEVITKNGGEIAGVTDMGTRKLAYKIDKYERGSYFVIYFTAPASLIAELTRNVRISEEIIRFLVVKYESKLEISAWKKLSKGQKLFIPKPREQKKPRVEKVEKAEKVENEEENKEETNK